MLKNEEFYRIPPPNSVYDFVKSNIQKQMLEIGLPTLSEKNIRDLEEKGGCVIQFGGLSIFYVIVEKDLLSVFNHLTPDEIALTEKYK